MQLENVPDLSVVILAFNEGDNLPQVIDHTLAVLQTQHSSAEILVINDGSTDDTGVIAQDYAARNPMVRVVHHAINCGYGAGMRSGAASARGIFVTFIPADGEVQVEEVLKLRNLAIDGIDLVVSSRRALDADAARAVRPWWREILSLGVRSLSRVVVGFDPAGKEGILLYRRSAAIPAEILSDTGLAHLELMMRIIRRGGRMAEGEIVYHTRLSGVSKVANAATLIRYLVELGKLRFNLRSAAEDS